MAKKDEVKATIFDQRNQVVAKQVNVVGQDGQVNKINFGESSEKIFDQVYKFLASSDNLSEQKKKEIEEKILQVQTEVKKGDSADGNLITVLLRSIAEQLPEIIAVLLDAILDPVVGATTGIKMIAKQILKRK